MCLLYHFWVWVFVSAKKGKSEDPRCQILIEIKTLTSFLNWQPFGNSWWVFIVSRQEPLPTSTAERSTIELSGAKWREVLYIYKYCGKLLLASFEQIIYTNHVFQRLL